MDASNELYKTDEFRMAYMKVCYSCIDEFAHVQDYHEDAC
jgi:hypothetical protein